MTDLNGEVYRPYPPPRGSWVMRQTWSDLLFAHWPVSVEALRAVVPASLPLDTFEGQTWLGVVPFRMSGVRARFAPALPGLSAFPELNVRTYVTRNGRPGVYFFSLDAANAVAAARILFHLPYFRAHMRLTHAGGEVAYDSVRTHRGAPPAAFHGRYASTGPAAPPPPGSLAYFLTARYCLYATDEAETVYRAEIDHAPWPLQAAAAEIAVNTLAAAHNLALPDTPPLLHFARRLEVRVWPPRRLLHR